MERDNNRNDQSSRIPENDPSKAMDSKREVESANDGKIDQDFPGYPHYPAKEDIMDQRTGAERVDLNVDEYASGPNSSGVNQRFLAGNEPAQARPAASGGAEADTEGTSLGTTGEGVNDDDLLSLDSREEEIGIPQNVSNEELNDDTDLPGSDLEGEDYNSLGRDQD